MIIIVFPVVVVAVVAEVENIDFTRQIKQLRWRKHPETISRCRIFFSLCSM
jgi:hypothetical protein